MADPSKPPETPESLEAEIRQAVKDLTRKLLGPATTTSEQVIGVAALSDIMARLEALTTDR